MCSRFRLLRRSHLSLRGNVNIPAREHELSMACKPRTFKSHCRLYLYSPACMVPMSFAPLAPRPGISCDGPWPQRPLATLRRPSAPSPLLRGRADDRLHCYYPRETPRRCCHQGRHPRRFPAAAATARRPPITLLSSFSPTGPP